MALSDYKSGVNEKLTGTVGYISIREQHFLTPAIFLMQLRVWLMIRLDSKTKSYIVLILFFFSL